MKNPNINISQAVDKPYWIIEAGGSVIRCGGRRSMAQAVNTMCELRLMREATLR